MERARPLGTLSLALLALSACKDPVEPPPPPPPVDPEVVSVEISPAETEVEYLKTTSFTANVVTKGNASRKVEWTAVYGEMDGGDYTAPWRPAVDTVCATSTFNENEFDCATVNLIPSTDGYIAFWSIRDGNDDIYIIKPNGSDLVRVTDHPGQDIRPDWSPDGEWIAFTSYREGSATSIYKVRPDGTGLQKLTTGFNYTEYPAWSPDGSHIAFQARVTGNDPVEIFTLNIESGEVARLTYEGVTSGKAPGRPTWSPDGEWVAFETARDGDWEVYKVRTDGSGEATNLSQNHDFLDGQPDWSWATNQIAFGSNRNGPDGDIFIMNPDGSGETELSNNEESEGTPTWSPDGSQIAFSRRVGESPFWELDVFIMNSDGSNQHNLTNTPNSPEAFASWWGPSR